jgi:competence protein ComEC
MLFRYVAEHLICPRIPPIFYLTCALIMGIVASFYSIDLYFIVASSAIFCSVLFKTKHTWFVLLCYLCLCYGAFAYRRTVREYENFYHQNQGKAFRIQGIVRDINAIPNKSYKLKVTLQPTHIAPAHQPITPAHGLWRNTITLYLYQQENFSIGDSIEARGVSFKKPQNQAYLRYLIKEKVAATVFLNHTQVQLLTRSPLHYSPTIIALRKRIFEQCNKQLSDSTAYLFSSLFLGNKSTETKSSLLFKKYCTTWGVNHYLARSGLHLVIFITVWSFLLIILPCSFTTKQIFLMLLSLLYSLLSWSSISFIRALLMFIGNKICLLTSTPPHLLHILMATCFVMLIHNPFVVFFLDFQLSFGATFALAWHNQLSAHAKKKY